MYRPEIKVLDCTIRDGGLMNNWAFDKEMVREVFAGLAAAGVDYIELGYRADKKIFSPEEFGIWRFTNEDDLRDVAFESEGSKISVMCDVGRTDYDDILPKSDSIVSMMRIATYVKDMDKAIHLAEHCKNKGYETTVNIMAISHALDADLTESLNELAASPVDVIYLVDSFGTFYCEQIRILADKYLDILGPAGKEIGLHMHNNMQLAFSNTIEGIIKGCNYLDATLFGMGRAAGNCPLELLVDFLKNPKFDVRPLLDLVQKHFAEMKRELRWGYEVPYAITGLLNKHPNAAMTFMQGSLGESSYREFYDMLLQVEE